MILRDPIFGTTFVRMENPEDEFVMKALGKAIAEHRQKTGKEPFFRRASDEDRAARSVVFRRAAEPVRAFLLAHAKAAETTRSPGKNCNSASTTASRHTIVPKHQDLAM